MGFFDKWSKPKTPQATPQEQLNTSNSKASTLNKAARVGLTAGVIARASVDAIAGQKVVQQDTIDQTQVKELAIDNHQDEAQRYAEKHRLIAGDGKQKVPQAEAEVDEAMERIGREGISPDYSNPENVPTGPTADLPEESEYDKNTSNQHRIEQSQPALNTEPPVIADINDGKPLNIGGKIHWENLSPAPSQKDKTRKKSNWLNPDEHDIEVSPDEKTEIWTNKKTGKKTIRPHRSLQNNGHIKEFPPSLEQKFYHLNGKPIDEKPNTLDLTPHLKKETHISSYDGTGNLFGTPKSMPTKNKETESNGGKNNQEENQNKKSTPDQQQSPNKKPTPDKPSSPQEESPEPTKPPERLKVNRPTAIAFESDKAPEKEDGGQSADSLAQITEIIENIEPEQLGASGVRKLLKLGTTLTTLALAALNADNALANNTGQVNLDKSTEHTLTNTKEARNQTVRSAYFQWLTEYEKYMFDEKPLTKEKFVEDYNNSHPNANISIAELDEFAYKSSLNKSNLTGKIKPNQPRFSIKGSTGATLKGLPNLPKTKTPNTKIKFSTGNNPYSTPKTPQNQDFNPGESGGNWNINQNKPGYTINSEGNISNTPDIDPTADFGAGGFQNE